MTTIGPSAALLAHWPLDDGAGITAHEQISGTDDPIAYVFSNARFKPDSAPLWRAGVRGGALLLDGYSTLIEHSDGLIAAPLQQLTITAWVAPASFAHGDAGQLAALVDQHEQQAGFVLGLFRHGTWSLQAGTGAEWLELWAHQRRVPAGRWSHLAAVYDAPGGSMALFLDGEPVARRSIPAGVPIAPAPGPLLIGRNRASAMLEDVFAANMFHGLLDELRMYGCALDQHELRRLIDADLAAAGSALPAPDLAPRRERYAGDRHRPRYHFMPPAHWMNEPHAPLRFDGQYHLFYQHNPQGPYWHHIHWGHAVSPDLVHWRDLPVALAPEYDAVDPDGCWSGSAALDDSGVPCLFYAAGDDRRSPNQAVGLARSTVAHDGNRDLVRWEKHGEPLVVQQPGAGLWGQFRDPFVWKEDGRWYMLVTSGVPGRGGTALVYTSDDMLDWSYGGPLFVGDVERFPETGDVWELPILLPLGSAADGMQRHILIVNPWFVGPSPHYCKYIYYWIGTWDSATLRFTPDTVEPRPLDLGEHLIGPSALLEDERIVLFSIVRDGLPPDYQYALGWAHNGGLPMALSLRSDGRLGVEPIAELESLRAEHLLSLRDVTVARANHELAAVGGKMLEIVLECDAPGALTGLAVRRSADGAEETPIVYAAHQQQLCIDRAHSSLDPNVEHSTVGGGLDLAGSRFRLRVFVDHSMISAFVSGLYTLTTRVYPTRDAEGVAVIADDPASSVRLDVWRLESAYAE